MKQNLLIAIGFATGLAVFVLFLLGKPVLLAIIVGALLAFLVFALWNPPKKYKEFTDADRFEATWRSMGGSGPPELPLPDAPPIKREKGHKKRKQS